MGRDSAGRAIHNILIDLQDRLGNLDQLWRLRDEQYQKHRQLSTEFQQFEHDTRQVRGGQNLVGFQYFHSEIVYLKLISKLVNISYDCENGKLYSRGCQSEKCYHVAALGFPMHTKTNAVIAEIVFCSRR